jgi:hypothetical protein
MLGADILRAGTLRHAERFWTNPRSPAATARYADLRAKTAALFRWRADQPPARTAVQRETRRGTAAVAHVYDFPAFAVWVVWASPAAGGDAETPDARDYNRPGYAGAVELPASALDRWAYDFLSGEKTPLPAGEDGALRLAGRTCGLFYVLTEGAFGEGRQADLEAEREGLWPTPPDKEEPPPFRWEPAPAREKEPPAEPVGP